MSPKRFTMATVILELTILSAYNLTPQLLPFRYKTFSGDVRLLLLLLMLKCCFTSTEAVGLLGTGALDVHFHFHTAPSTSTLVLEGAEIPGGWEERESLSRLR